ncbi:MAG TPA: AAA family ATPase, partial [Thermomicrobiales bacterium]|nr:AAA family ATPase [Thermomicrobiales bacterium]
MASQQRVFISYHRSDEVIARQVREQLASHGVASWMDQYDIPVGAYWPDKIDKGLASCGTVIGILSPASVESRNVKNEWDWTIQNGKLLLLVQVSPCVIPHRYVSINYIDGTSGDEQQVIASLFTALGVSPQIAPVTAPDGAGPPVRSNQRRAGPRLLKPLIVGRDTELKLLQQTLDDLRVARGSLVLVSGEAGIGKTTLTTWLLAEAEERGLLPLSGGCYDLTTTPPYGPWAEILAGFPEDDDLHQVPAQLRAGGGLAGIDSQAALFDLTIRFLTSVAEVRPLVLLLEDLHWADPASLDFLRFASRSIQHTSILLLATYRDDEITRDHPLSALLPALVREAPVHRLHLGRLERPAVLDLVRERYELPAGDEARLIAYLLDLAEGNPFFTRELLHSLEEQRLLVLSVGAWALADLADSSVPSLIHQIIEGRLARLDLATRSLLERAAVVGFDTPLDILQTLDGTDDRELDDALHRAIEHHIVTINHGSRSIHFSHALVRQAIYQAIPPLRRQALHRAVGGLLAERPRADRSIVANHFFEARDERALDWLVRSARAAQRLFAPETVIAECSRAITLSDALGRDISPSAFRLRSWARDSTGDFDGALHDLTEALKQARNADDQPEEWQSLLDLAELWAARDYQRTGEYCRQAVEIARTMGDQAALGHSLNRLGNWHANADLPSAALRYHDEAQQIFEAIGDQHGLASTLDLLGTTYAVIGDVTQEMRNYELAISLLRQLDDRRTLSSALA